MKGETAEQVAERIRSIASSMSEKGDAAEIVRYADWLVGRRPGGSSSEPPAFGSWPANSTKAPTDER